MQNSLNRLFFSDPQMISQNSVERAFRSGPSGPMSATIGVAASRPATRGGPVRFILSGGGHIAGVINPPADKKRGYLINEDERYDPDAWLAGATQHEGSWWVDWLPWLQDRSGGQAKPPATGNEAFQPIMDAPGAYVLEK